jgi:hypothetical protein
MAIDLPDRDGGSGGRTGSRNESYPAGRFALELDQRDPVGWVTHLDRGGFKGEMITNYVGSGGGEAPLPGRFQGKPKFEEITLGIGMARSPSFWNWIKASFDNRPERRSGALVGYDFNSNERSRRTFKEALLSEITFPTLDASSTKPANITVKICPEELEYQKGDGHKLQPSQALNEGEKQKLWLEQNFTFVLDRFAGDDTLKHSKIESFTVKQGIMEQCIGNCLTSRRIPGRLELPQLQVTLPEPRLEDWMQWYEECLHHGQYDKGESTGAIVYKASDLSDLMTIHLDGVGLTNLDVENYEAGKLQMARIRATLYVERMSLVIGKGNS